MSAAGRIRTEGAYELTRGSWSAQSCGPSASTPRRERHLLRGCMRQTVVNVSARVRGTTRALEITYGMSETVGGVLGESRCDKDCFVSLMCCLCADALTPAIGKDPRTGRVLLSLLFKLTVDSADDSAYKRVSVRVRGVHERNSDTYIGAAFHPFHRRRRGGTWGVILQ